VRQDAGGIVTARRQPRLVRYVSPFASPAWLTEDHALALLAEEAALYEALRSADGLSPRQRQLGEPRIERRNR
jgi:hypothetical protein